MLRSTTRATIVRPTLIWTAAAALAVCGALSMWAQAKPGAAEGPRYRSPFDVAYSPCGKMLAVSDRTAGVVALIDSASDKVVCEIPTGGKPSDLAWSADASRVYVADHAVDKVVEIDPKARKVTRRLTVGPRPIAVATAPKRKLLLATNVGTNDVSIVDLADGKQRGRVAVLREPRSLAISPDESIALVGNHLPEGPASNPEAAAAVSVIDLNTLKRVGDIRLPAGSTVVRGIAISPCGCWAYVVHTVGRFNIPTTQLERGWVNTNAMSILALEKKQVFATVLLDHPSQGSADPWGVRLSKDGGVLWIAISGSHELVRIDMMGLHKLLKGDLSGRPRLAKPDPRNPGPLGIWHAIKKDPGKRAQLVNELAALHAADLIVKKAIPGKGPRGIDLSCDGKRIALATYFSGKVVFADAATCKPCGEVAVGTSPKPDLVRLGEIAFHDATLCFQHWLSCTTCHPQGRVDGLNWDLLNDGMGNPKNTKSLVWSHKTPPVMARGVRASMDVASLAGFRHILFREPEPQEVKAVRAYLRAIAPVASPHLSANGQPTEQAKRGKAIFDDSKTNCAVCHPPGLSTDLKIYNVGTRQTLDRVDRFDTPTLTELWRTGPYLHNGSAATIKDVLTKFNKGDKHGTTSHLSAKEIDDLVAYLMSL